MRAWGLCLITLASVIALGCGDKAIVNPITPPQMEEVTPFRIVAHLDGAGSHVTVWRGNDPVEAEVTVRGLPVPRSASSSAPAYSVERNNPTGPLVLEVTVDGHTARAMGNIPESPLLASPASGTAYFSNDSIALVWTSETNPEFFEIFVNTGFCCGPSVIADGTARAVKVAASELGFFGKGRLFIRAVNRGSVTEPAAQDSQILLSSTSNVEFTINRLLEEVAPFTVHAFLGGQHQLVFAVRDGEGIGQDAVEIQLVTVNGQPITRTNIHRGNLSVVPGPVVLEVTVDGHTARAMGDMPATPFLTAAASGTVFASSDSIAITWSSATDPEFFEIYASACCAWDYGSKSIVADGTARALKIAAKDLGFLGNGQLYLRAVNLGGTFSEPADPNSPWRLSSTEAEMTLTVTP